MTTYIDSNQEAIVVKHFTSYIDEYGQQHTESTERASKMFLRPTKMVNNNDPLYNHVSLCGVSQDDSITDEDNILYKGIEYKVVQKVPTPHKVAYLLEIYEH